MTSRTLSIALVVAGAIAASGAAAQEGSFGLQSPGGDGFGSADRFGSGAWSQDFFIDGQAAQGPEPEPQSAVQDAPELNGSGAAIEWIGKPLVSSDGSEVGTVREVTVDTGGMVSEIHADIGSGFLGMFTETVSIPAARILLEQEGKLLAEMSADENPLGAARRGRGLTLRLA